jgi:adenosylcobinamide-GDP ribazoletransferase
MKYFLGAFNLLTTLPFPLPKDWQAGDSGRSAGWYSFVGLCIGALVAGSLFLFRIFFSNMASAALSLAIWVMLTGGLHLDGLADCFDGMFHASDPEHRLQIMRDPHIGAFGVIGLVLILLLKFSLLSSISSNYFPLSILLSASFARWCVVLAGKQSLARSDGMAADFASGLQTQSVILSALIPLGLVVWLGKIGLLAAGLGWLTAFIILGIAKRNLGGVTGDVFGLIVELVETTMLLAFTIISKQVI